VSPGYWDDWRKNIRYINGLARETGKPNIRVSLTEDTYQKGYYKRYPANTGETFSVSQLSAPGYTVGGSTLNRLLSHGVGAAQLDFIASASGLYQHYWYSAVDEIDFNNNPGYDAIDGNNGKFDRPADFNDRPQSWPAHYYTTSRKVRLTNFKFVDSVITKPRGLHVFKYVHISNPDSVMYEFAILDSTGTDTFKITGLNNTKGKLITPSAISKSATETLITIVNKNYTLTADALPKAIIVYNPLLNQVPVANAGNDITIQAPVSQVVLSGTLSTDPNGDIITYAWTKISGPGSFTITNPSSVTTTVTRLKPGTYVFRLTVTDNDGAQANDTVTVIVQPPS